MIRTLQSRRAKARSTPLSFRSPSSRGGLRTAAGFSVGGSSPVLGPSSLALAAAWYVRCKQAGASKNIIDRARHAYKDLEAGIAEAQSGPSTPSGTRKRSLTVTSAPPGPAGKKKKEDESPLAKKTKDKGKGKAVEEDNDKDEEEELLERLLADVKAKEDAKAKEKEAEARKARLRAELKKRGLDV
ncbi:hypothetical protein VTJ83DRAFT_2835 [Remersonia thermophila]|uniref:Uncharacterized protein n=1 Tax=Remersonia thermophila TaxID=72144 RepID=A0ABR4DEI8_9PEZI